MMRPPPCDQRDASVRLATQVGPVVLRPERPDDSDFLYTLFHSHAIADLAALPMDAAMKEALVRMQFASQTTSYRSQFPIARFDIVERNDEPVGRIVVDQGADTGCIVDFVLLPDRRSRGLGSAILAAVLRGFTRPVRCKVLLGNEPSLRMCRRVGFGLIEEIPPFLQLEWRPPVSSGSAPPDAPGNMPD